MKHLKPFNESVDNSDAINDIFNIAVDDEMVNVRKPGIYNNRIISDIYTISMDKDYKESHSDHLIGICSDIYNRLVNEDIAISIDIEYNYTYAGHYFTDSINVRDLIGYEDRIRYEFNRGRSDRYHGKKPPQNLENIVINKISFCIKK